LGLIVGLTGALLDSVKSFQSPPSPGTASHLLFLVSRSILIVVPIVVAAAIGWGLFLWLIGRASARLSVVVQWAQFPLWLLFLFVYWGRWSAKSFSDASWRNVMVFPKVVFPALLTGCLSYVVLLALGRLLMKGRGQGVRRGVVSLGVGLWLASGLWILLVGG